MFKMNKWIVLMVSVILITSGALVAQAAQRTSLSIIEKNYHGAKILKVIHYQKRYIMIEYQYPTTANHFDLYDLDTGERYGLPLGADYTNLDKIINQNDIVFGGNGVNSEVPQNVFPFVMVCTRKNSKSQFGLTEYPEYLNVNQGFTFTNGKNEEVKSYGFTQGGIEFQFGPLKNDPHGAFYAGTTWIPSTHISYNRQRNQLTVQFIGTSISGNLHVTNDPINYISSVRMHGSAQAGTSLVLQLKPDTQYYKANVTWKDGQQNVPELQLSFLPNNVTFKPGVVIYNESNGKQVEHFLKPMASYPPASNMAAPVSKPKTASITQKAILKFLPKGAKLIPSDPNGDVIDPIDLNNDGTNEYAALYLYQNAQIRLVGAIVVGEKDGLLHKLWQHSGLTAPASVSTKEVLNNGKRDLVFKAGLGAMANYFAVFTWENGTMRPIFQTSSARMDIVHHSGSGPSAIAAWTLDTGILYNIQMYGWNGKDQQYKPVQNPETPKYFTDTVIPYYLLLAKESQGKQVPKMIAYGLATAYYDAHDNQDALSEVNKGLKLSNRAYPPTNKFVELRNQIYRVEAHSTTIPQHHVQIR